ncbi:MAG: ABC transporter substrate-binding protein [Candidatus Nomurabacteria bacterium]|jgi:NitT/TauT family transport system substrate-binding protein|nr:ABC transporter substrate-binding protein [Candidatus Nomurabacteria bacterium]
MKNKIIVGVVALLVVTGVIIANIFISKQQPAKITLTAAYEYAQVSAVIDVIKEQNLFEKYMPSNVNIEWVSIGSGSDRRDALATERVAVAVLENTKVVPSIENDYPIMILANGSKSMSALYSADPNIKSPTDLAGKRIAYQGTKNIILKSDLGRNYRVDISDDQLLSVGEADLISLLVQGQVDAAILTNVMAEKAVALNSNVKMFHDLTPETEYIGVANWLVGSAKFFDEHPELLQPVMSAYQAAIDTINEDPKGISDLLAPLFNIDASQIEKEFRTFPPGVEIYSYDEMAKILLENGDLDKPAKPFNQLPNYESIPKK